MIQGECDLLDAQGEAVIALREGELFGLDQGVTLGVCAAQARGPVTYASFDAHTVRSFCQETPALSYFFRSPEPEKKTPLAASASAAPIPRST